MNKDGVYAPLQIPLQALLQSLLSFTPRSYKKVRFAPLHAPYLLSCVVARGSQTLADSALKFVASFGRVRTPRISCIRFGVGNLNAFRNPQVVGKSVFAWAKHSCEHEKAKGEEGCRTTTEGKKDVDNALDPSFLDQVPYGCGNDTKEREGHEIEQSVRDNSEEFQTRNYCCLEAAKQNEKQESWQPLATKVQLEDSFHHFFIERLR